MSSNQNKTYEEFELDYNYSVRHSDEYNVVLKDGEPFVLLNHTNVYNKIFDFNPRVKSIKMEKDKISIDFIVETEEFKNHDLSEFKVNVGYSEYNFTTNSKGIHHVEIPYNNINIPGKSVGILLKLTDKNGFTFKKKFLSKTGPNNGANIKLYTSKIYYYKNHSIYIYETFGGYISLAYREINYTDSLKEQKKIELAFLKQKIESKLGKNKPSILLYEKFCGKYEESAKYIYQKLIDDGCEDVYFILDKNSEYYKEVPEKYRKNIIDRYSFKHYYEYFNAKAFISTESFFHAIEPTNYNQLVRRKRMWDNFYYFFLQHGVMYAYSLKGRNSFIKGSGFRKNSYIVISSETEGKHFIEQGKFDREDLIKSGLPKFDHALQNKDADKILIMPTSRNFEHSVIRDDTENSTYYNFSKRIIESVPDELKDKIVFMPHPLINKLIKDTDLNKYIPNEFNYEKLLKNTRLLITDYSSISYDAFYRGCNVIFAWMEKEMCLENLGVELMLNEDNSFADIAYDYNTLTELISKNYYESHSKENIKKYEDIVEFHDGNNTQRFINYIYDTNVFQNKANKKKINDAIIDVVEDRPYKEDEEIRPKIKISYDGKKLVNTLDYVLEYKDNKAMGTANIKKKGKGSYKGSRSINFKIKKNINNCELKINENTLSIIDTKILSPGEDYITEIEDYPELAIKKIIVRGIGEYAGVKVNYITTNKE
ncbi:MAG: CDP-glycerol glycerophosphotransferase family protein [archaeon]|nr:CDP-glycerol glycerophosphotransferase family protein [archaeon]